MSERQMTSVALYYIPWSTAAVGLSVPTLNGAVSSDEFSTSNRRGGQQRLVSSNLSGRKAEQSNDHTSLLRIISTTSVAGVAWVPVRRRVNPTL